MTVAELKAKLDEFGDDMPVMILTSDDIEPWSIGEVDSHSYQGTETLFIGAQ